MPDTNHVLERRATAIAEKMKGRVDALKDFIRPAGERPPFTQQLNDENALKWWRTHRYDMLGARVLQSMKPNDIAELDAALAQAIEASHLQAREQF